jgi:hypothetical protein
VSPLSDNDIEAELSYAYIHAVASKAGVGCKIGSRHDDNAGIDAELTGWGPFPNGGYREEIDIKVQLKATVKPPLEYMGKYWSYSLSGISRYDDLRSDALSTPRILVVLFLPADADWLTLDDEGLILRKCAYWVSLRGAKPSTNRTAQTVYLPKDQRFDPNGLIALMAQLSRNEIPQYQEMAG